MPAKQDQSPWVRRRETESRRIELAALQLCLERGIDGVTVEEIAQAAGISRRTFYRYFETIDEVLIASPKRSIDRIASGIRARPASEGVREALIRGAYEAGPSSEERALQMLGSRLARQFPDRWWRAIARIQPTAGEIFERLVTERLESSNQDPGYASLIAAVWNAVIGFTVRSSRTADGFTATPSDLDAAFSAIADAIAD